jgi:hypothetical protein
MNIVSAVIRVAFSWALFGACMPTFAGEQNSVAGGSAGAAPSVSVQSNPAALLRAQQKFAHALAATEQLKEHATVAGVSGEQWRFAIVANLMKGSENDFDSVALANSYQDGVRAALHVARAGAAAETATAKSLGDAATDLVYVPITPCRIADSRNSGGPIAASTVKQYTYDATNGGASGCSVMNQIPGANPSPAAFAVNITVDETGLSGFLPGSFLQAYPAGTSTSTSFMNFGPDQIISNAGVIALNTDGEFDIYSNAPTNVIIDAYGVFIAPQATALSCTPVVAAQSIAPGATGMNTTTSTCPADTSTVSAYCFAPTQTTTNTGSGVVAPGAFCSWVNNTGAAVTVYQGVLCCKVPGR